MSSVKCVVPTSSLPWRILFAELVVTVRAFN
ncbi:hypothetical protein M6B38_270845 [Iris pallida]|uniref:Uncharacterized protein n=1 Tax=Iris pallida TaxID=29817 RepID=A0AAX6H4S9_IRIPA|nr:hypothetical protein M6B38_380595 [Iris pallida]KAJ6835577.1 hypothetical protein M6B38_331320 [Iris pallida]KAJ6849169.1 hypothetical protein M6B38_270845 [Iris pallida]